MVHNNALSSEKVHLLLSLRSQSTHILVRSVLASVQISLLIQTRTHLHWRKRFYGLWTRIWVQNVLMLDLFQLLSSPDVKWWTVDYCDVFIRLSFWRHPFTAEHPLLRHWCNATFLQIRWTNKLIFILDDLRMSTCSANALCFRDCSFKSVYFC